jgi:hypothetical protein
MLPFGMTILATVLQRLEIPDGLINYPVFLSLLVNFQFFNIHLPRTAPGLDLFSGAYLYIFTVSVVLSDLE